MVQALYLPGAASETARAVAGNVEAMEAALMEDLCVFMNRADLPPVLQAAIAHAQFETIHPYPDGNGRVGRALIHLVLRRRGAAPRFVPPVSLVLAPGPLAWLAY